MLTTFTLAFLLFEHLFVSVPFGMTTANCIYSFALTNSCELVASFATSSIIDDANSLLTSKPPSTHCLNFL